MKKHFDLLSQKVCKQLTQHYSTSFSLGILVLHRSIRPHIYSIYGFVRLADEIVDSFDTNKREQLFEDFERDYKRSIELKISANPILNAFQNVAHEFDLFDLVTSFLGSMRKDLQKGLNYKSFEDYEKYIFGSADVVGLMCLKVFLNKDQERYDYLRPYATKLGSALQKVNFLRDYAYDSIILERSYFPNVDKKLTQESHQYIIEDARLDFEEAYRGIVQLPKNCKHGVYIAYKYYTVLLKKLKKASPELIETKRIRISNLNKLWILVVSYTKFR